MKNFILSIAAVFVLVSCGSSTPPIEKVREQVVQEVLYAMELEMGDEYKALQSEKSKAYDLQLVRTAAAKYITAGDGDVYVLDRSYGGRRYIGSFEHIGERRGMIYLTFKSNGW